MLVDAGDDVPGDVAAVHLDKLIEPEDTVDLRHVVDLLHGLEGVNELDHQLD